MPGAWTRRAARAWLPEIGLNYYNARFYSPPLGQCMPADPTGYGDGVNLCTYVGGDPVNATDPTGLATIVVKGCREPKPQETGPVKTTPGGFDNFFAGSNPTGFGDQDEADRALERKPGEKPNAKGKRSGKRCGSGSRVKISPFGVGITGFIFIGGLSGGVEGGISIPVSALRGNFRGTQLYASASFTALAGLGAFVGGGSNIGAGYTRAPVRTETGRSLVLQGGAAVKAGGGGVKLNSARPLDSAVVLDQERVMAHMLEVA